MANDKNFKIQNGLDVGDGTLTQTTSGDSRNYFRSSTGDRSYAYFQNSDTGTTDSDGLLVGINSSEAALFYHQEPQPVYIGSNGVVQRLTLESDGDFLIYNTNATAVVAKFNALTNDVELIGDIIFEGSTSDSFETTVTVADPTADRTFTIPNQTGTAMLWQQAWPDDPAPSGGNIAIGENTLNSATSSDIRNVAIGLNALPSATTEKCIGIGAYSLYALTTGERNVAVGDRAGVSIISGSDNTQVGYEANLGGTGYYNTCFGSSAGWNLSGQSYTTNIGYQAGYESGSYSVNVGYRAGYNTNMNNGAIGSVLIGYLAGDTITSGDYNTVIGYISDVESTSSQYNFVGGYLCRGGNNYNVVIGYRNAISSTADRNIVIGQAAGGVESSSTSFTTSDNNVIIGGNIYSVNDGGFNVIIGQDATGTGTKNGLGYMCAVGPSALRTLTSGDFNVGLGASAGYRMQTGDNNTYLGTNSGGTSGSTGHSTGSNCSFLGYNAIPSSSSASNEITLGNVNITSLRCNVTTISSLSDERDKTDIEDLPYGLDFINDMRPVQFTWDRRDGSMNNVPDFGFIAQDLHDVELNHSSTNRTRLVKWENPDKLEADYVRSYPILVKAVQELSAKCDALEARLAALEGV